MTVMIKFFGEMTRSQIRFFTFIHVKTLKRETCIKVKQTNKIIMTNTSYSSYHLQGEWEPQDSSSSASSSQAVGYWFEEIELGDESLIEGVEQGLVSLNEGVEQGFSSQNEGVQQGLDSWNEGVEPSFDSWNEECLDSPI